MPHNIEIVQTLAKAIDASFSYKNLIELLRDLVPQSI
jgi:hypothetical protein